MSRQDRLQWFDALKRIQADAVQTGYDLLVELAIPAQIRQQIQDATIRFIGAALGNRVAPRTPDAFMAEVDGRLDDLFNRTPNGVVLPKQEFESEFNNLHAVMSGYVKSLGLDHIIDSAFAPVTVRLIKGTSDRGADDRPFASTKTHVDLWSGEPGDHVTMFVPILGNIEQATVEFFHPPDDLEARLLKTLSSYDEGHRMLGQLERYDLQMRHGSTYFMDAAVPHRTVNRGGGSRVTLQLAFRRATNATERAEVEQACDPGRLAHYIPLRDWYALGTSKRMQFADTFADAKRGSFTPRPYNEPIYTLTDATAGASS